MIKLDFLRDNAGKDNLECEKIIEDIFTKLPSYSAINTVLNLVIRFLPDITNTDDILWVKEWVKVSRETQPIDYSIHSFAFYADYDSSISASFANIIGELNSSIQSYRLDLNKVIGIDIAHSIARLAGLRIFAYRLKNFPQSWFSQDEREKMGWDEAIRRVEEYKNAPQTLQHIRETWLIVANEIEQNLPTDFSE